LRGARPYLLHGRSLALLRLPRNHESEEENGVINSPSRRQRQNAEFRQ